MSQESIDFWKDHAESSYTYDPKYNDGKPIPDFWMKFFENSDIYLGESDLPILKHLEKMEIIKQKDPVQK